GNHIPTRVGGDPRRRGRGIGIAMGIALAVSLCAASNARAQNCGPGLPILGVNGIGLLSSAMAASATATSDIVAANTAFLTQSTAFVSAPPNPQPGQEGGGVWVRGVGGDLTFKSSQTLNLSVTGAGVPGTTASTSGNCTTKFRETFGGVQVGAD